MNKPAGGEGHRRDDRVFGGATHAPRLSLHRHRSRGCGGGRGEPGPADRPDESTAPRLDFHLFSGQQDDENYQLPAGRIGKNLMFGGNLYYRLAPNVLLALEWSQLRTVYIGQDERKNNHDDLALAYLF